MANIMLILCLSLIAKLSSVDENRITQQNASRKTTRHSSALPTTKIDTSLFKIRQAKHSTSATVYNKVSVQVCVLTMAYPPCLAMIITCYDFTKPVFLFFIFYGVSKVFPYFFLMIRILIVYQQIKYLILFLEEQRV